MLSAPANQSAKTGNRTAKEKQRYQSERALKALTFAIGVGIVGIFVYSINASFIKTVSYLGMGVMVAGAALLVGGLLGFLFGIPRTLQSGGPAQSPTGRASDHGSPPDASTTAGFRRPDYQANTNLEQISDWLTKILVGVGLTQVREIGGKMYQVSGAVAWAFDSPNGNRSFSLSLILFYLVVGFLFAYLWTRLYLAEAFREADRETLDALDSLDTKVDQMLDKVDAVEAKTDAVQSVAELGVGKPQSLGVQKMLLEVSDQIQPGPNPDDPWKGAFGGSNESNGRKLSASVTPIAGRSGLYSIHLTVTATDSKNEPLTGVVQFFLHETFKEQKPIVKVGPSGVAELDLVAWGAFTVGALADNGQTRLELDLSQLETAPLEFRRR